MIERQFEFIKSCINKSGQVVDPRLKSPLNFQYHYSSFVLSCVLQGDNSQLQNVLAYYLSIPAEVMKPSHDFNVFLLLLALRCDKDGMLKDYQKQIKGSLSFNSDEELYQLNNNFRALRLTGMVLYSELFGEERFVEKVEGEIEWLLALQFDDGFFPDSNLEYAVEKNKGVPHLTYHAKITMCLGLVYLETGRGELLKPFLKAVDVLLDISSQNYFFFYGRSTNSLFGYGSFSLALILAYKFTGNSSYLQRSNEIRNFLSSYQHPDGHVSINLTLNDQRRLGFDTYMYDVVYNCYSNAMFMFADFLCSGEKKNTEFLGNHTSEPLTGMRLYRNSGFVHFSDGASSYCLNYKGHQNSKKHFFDSRVSPFSILYWFENKRAQVPGPGYKLEPILRLVEKKFPIRLLRSILYRIIYHRLIPLLSGNSFAYKRGKYTFYPYKCLRLFSFDDCLILKFQARTRSLLTRTVKEDQFVLRIQVSNPLVYHIHFYEEADKLLYTYRLTGSNSNLSIYFDQPLLKLRKMHIATSTGTGLLYKAEFRKLSKLKIKVNTL